MAVVIPVLSDARQRAEFTSNVKIYAERGQGELINGMKGFVEIRTEAEDLLSDSLHLSK